MAWGMNPAPNWTPAEKDRLRTMLALGIRISAIADELGRSRNAVCGMIYRLGLKLPAGETYRAPRPKPPAPAPKPKIKPEDTFFLNGEPLIFAEPDRACARCGVRESQHHAHGCGQFAAEVTVRIR